MRGRYGSNLAAAVDIGAVTAVAAARVVLSAVVLGAVMSVQQCVRMASAWALLRLAAATLALAVAGRVHAQGMPGFGRNLYVKSYPAVPDFKSNPYEDPGFSQGSPTSRALRQAAGFDYEPMLDCMDCGPLGTSDSLGRTGNAKMQLRGPQGLRAVVDLQPAVESSSVQGRLVLSQAMPNGPVAVLGNLTGLPPGRHGLHVHQSGDLDNNCGNIGPHFIAFWGRHGGPRDEIRHVGDLGNIDAKDGKDETLVKLVDHVIQLAGPRSVAGRSLAVSKNEDDYGRANTEESALTGSSGPPLACGIIAYLN